MSHNARFFIALTIATSASAFLNEGGLSAQSARRPVKTPVDVCRIGDIEEMSTSGVKANYAGTWRLDPSRSEGLSALWASATNITLVVTQDAKRLKPALTVAVGANVMVNSRYSHPFDGSADYRPDGKGEVISDLRYDDGGRAVVLRTTEFAQVDDVEIVHEVTQRWELAERGRVLHVCRRLEGPLTRTVSKLVFVKGERASIPAADLRR